MTYYFSTLRKERKQSRSRCTPPLRMAAASSENGDQECGTNHMTSKHSTMSAEHHAVKPPDSCSSEENTVACSTEQSCQRCTQLKKEPADVSSKYASLHENQRRAIDYVRKLIKQIESLETDLCNFQRHIKFLNEDQLHAFSRNSNQGPGPGNSQARNLNSICLQDLGLRDPQKAWLPTSVK